MRLARARFSNDDTRQHGGVQGVFQHWCLSEYDRVLQRHPWLPTLGVLWCVWCTAALGDVDELLSLAQLVPWIMFTVTLLALNICEVAFQSLLKSWPGSIAWDLTFYDASEEEAFHSWSAGRGLTIWRACHRAALIGSALLRALGRYQRELHPPLGGISSAYVLTAMLPLGAWAGMHLLAATRPLLTRRRLAVIDISAQLYLWALAFYLPSWTSVPLRAGYDAPPTWIMVLIMQQYDAVLFWPPASFALPSALVGSVGTIALNFGCYLRAAGAAASLDEKSRTLLFSLLSAALHRLVSFCVCYVLETRQIHRFMYARHGYSYSYWLLRRFW